MTETAIHSIDPTLEYITDFGTEDAAKAYAQVLAAECGVAEVHHSVLGWEVWA